MTREERLNALALRHGCGYLESVQNGERKSFLTDDDGQSICRLSTAFVEALADIDDGDAEAILVQLHSVHLGSTDAAYRRGQLAGRSVIISAVHELLGVDRIAAALEEAATCSR